MSRQASGVWALGDFDQIMRATTAQVGALLVEACGVHAGQRLLDVGAGTGNVALPAARAGAAVVASDITPELMAVGRAAAEAEGLRIDWIQADAQALPFEDGAFDVVTSSFGAIFAPDHRATASNLLRVLRPGGTLGMLNWTPESWPGQMFATLAQFMPPPPPGFEAPSMWGWEPHLRELLGARVAQLRTELRSVVIDHFKTPADIVLFYRANFGPLVAAYAALADAPERALALDEALLDFARRTNLAVTEDGTRYELEFLLVVAQTPASA
jgi:ubiquinone/menaquinone biosynthesis C-methylase UbiE